MINAALAMLAIGAVLGFVLGVASKVFHVDVDARIEEVTKLLPNYNCGACGYPGCSGLAKAMVDKELDSFVCRPCKPDKRQEIIDYLANTPGPDGETITIKCNLK